MALRKKKKDWTLILISDNGPAGSFQLRRGLFRILVLLLLGVFATAGTWLYFNELNHVTAREQLSRKVSTAEKSLERVLLMNREMTAMVGELEQALAAALDEPGVARETIPVTGMDLSGRMNLSVENFEIARDPVDTTIRFKFLLRNSNETEDVATGYVFVLYRPDYLDSSTWKSFPSVSFTAGVPEDFRLGDSFNIARFKTVRGHFTNVSLTQSYCISVWVFSTDGALLLFRDYFFGE